MMQSEKTAAGENKVRSGRFHWLFCGFAATAGRFGRSAAAAPARGFSATAPVRDKIGSDFCEGAPPVPKTIAVRERAPANCGFPLHRVPFLPPAAGFSDTLVP